MTDFQRLKDTLQQIKCNFTSEPTLIGTTLSVYSDTKKGHIEMMFEFDCQGGFLRTIHTS